MKAYNLLFFGIIAILGIACQSTVPPSELVSYVKNPENGLNKNKKMGPLNMELQYKPIPFVISNELRRNTISSDEYQTRFDDLKGLQYYNLKLSISQKGMDVTNFNVADMGAQQERLQYLAFGMQHDIRLVQGSDTLRPVLYHFERSFNLTPHRTFVLAFEETESIADNDKVFILDSPIFNTGPMKLSIRKEAIQNIPNIKLL